MLERFRRGRDEGFTLIELLIVIIILGILAAIVVFAIGNTKKDAAGATCKTDVKSIQLAEEAYKVHNSTYAFSSTTLTDTTNGNLKTWPGTATLVFALSGTTGDYVLTISGADVAGGTLGPNSPDTGVAPSTAAACAGA